MKVKLSIVFLLIIFTASCAKEEIPIVSVKLLEKSVNLKVGESVVLTANIEPLNTTDPQLLWISRNETIATVTSSGSLNGVAFGKTFIIVKSSTGSLVDSCEVYVNGTVTGSTGNETITLGAGYANDVFYSMLNGVVATVPRTNWDIAFQTSSRSSTIIINDGAGIKLYTYPNGTLSAWNTVNTSGIGTWKTLNNSDTTWSMGAFERNALGHPDYGWGIYNSVTHDVIGDSLFIIQLKDQSYRKLWIKKKVSVDNKYIFQYANIDGSGSVLDTVDCKAYTAKNFIYYSFATSDVVDREPNKDDWDFVVTKYLEMIPDGSGGKVPYPVIGVLTNTGIRSAQTDNVSVTSNDYSSAKFVTTMSQIGSDWKSFNMTNNQWALAGNRLYFVKNKGLTVFKILFTGFEGSSTGIVKFDKSKLN